MKAMFGLWALLPYLPEYSLFIENKEEVILQQIEVEVTDISEITPEIFNNASNKQWYYLIEQLPTENRRPNSRH
jgi:L-rhamnose mutarotase